MTELLSKGFQVAVGQTMDKALEELKEVVVSLLLCSTTKLNWSSL